MASFSKEVGGGATVGQESGSRSRPVGVSATTLLVQYVGSTYCSSDFVGWQLVGLYVGP